MAKKIIQEDKEKRNYKEGIKEGRLEERDRILRLIEKIADRRAKDIHSWIVYYKRFYEELKKEISKLK